MKLSSDRLNALSALARTKNFSKAAQKLGLTQSALSQRIQKLEEELEVTLVVRNPLDIRLTEAGEQLVLYIHQVTELEEEVCGRIRKGKGSLSGLVRIGSYSSVTRSLLIPSLKSLAQKNPELQFEVFSREVRELLPMLKSGEVDYVLLNEIPQSEGIEFIRLGTEENVYITPLAEKYPVVFLDHDQMDSTTQRFFQIQDKKPAKIERNYFDDIYGIIDAVKNGLGQAIVSKHLLRGVPGIKIQKNYRSLNEPIVFAYRKAPYYSKKHQFVVDQLCLHVPKNLDKGFI